MIGRQFHIGLSSALILIGIVGTFSACGEAKQSSVKPIDNIALIDAGNSCGLENGKLVIHYDCGKKSATVPLKSDTTDPSTYFYDKAVYISDEVMAVAFGGAVHEEPVSVLISRDSGSTWNTYPVATTGADSAAVKFMGFTDENRGWLVSGGDTASGMQKDRVFLTSDGGKNWKEIGNTSETFPYVVTGAGFVDDQVGFISFRNGIGINPIVMRTENQGKAWSRCNIALPESFIRTTACATALSPVFTGTKGILPVTLTQNEDAQNGKSSTNDIRVWFTTTDAGKTWVYDETSLARLNKEQIPELEITINKQKTRVKGRLSIKQDTISPFLNSGDIVLQGKIGDQAELSLGQTSPESLTVTADILTKDRTFRYNRKVTEKIPVTSKVTGAEKNSKDIKFILPIDKLMATNLSSDLRDSVQELRGYSVSAVFHHQSYQYYVTVGTQLSKP